MSIVSPSGDLSGNHEARVLNAWVSAHSAAMLVGVLVAAVAKSALPLALAAALSFAFFWRHLAELRHRVGYANIVTAVRLALVLCAAVLMARVPPLAVLLIFGANVILDALDGWIARRTGLTTRFGAMFDREADAVFVLVAYAYFFVMQDFAAWILLPGILPYLYRFVAWELRDRAAFDGKQRLAATLAGTNYVLLLTAVLASQPLQTVILIVSTSVVTCSFLVSFWNLGRNEYSIS